MPHQQRCGQARCSGRLRTSCAPCTSCSTCTCTCKHSCHTASTPAYSPAPLHIWHHLACPIREGVSQHIAAADCVVLAEVNGLVLCGFRPHEIIFVWIVDFIVSSINITCGSGIKDLTASPAAAVHHMQDSTSSSTHGCRRSRYLCLHRHWHQRSLRVWHQRSHNPPCPSSSTAQHSIWHSGQHGATPHRLIAECCSSFDAALPPRLLAC